MTRHARLPTLRGRAGPQSAGLGNPEALACEPNVIQELAAASDSHHTKEFLHTDFTAFISLRAPHRLFSFSPLF